MQNCSLADLQAEKQCKHVVYEIGLKQNSPEKAEEYLKQAEQMGHTLAAFELGMRFLSGANPSKEDALVYLCKASSNGIPEASIEVGKIYEFQGEHELAKQYYKKAYHQGDPRAMQLFRMSSIIFVFVACDLFTYQERSNRQKIVNSNCSNKLANTSCPVSLL